MGLGEQIAARRQAERKMIEVFEWGEDGEPLVIYSGPLTGNELDKLQRKHKNFPEIAPMSSIVDLIIMKAEDAEGKKLFTLEDKMYLMKLDVIEIGQVSSQIMGQTVSIEEAEKN